MRIPKFDPRPIQLNQTTLQVTMMKMQGKWPSITSVAESILHVKVQEKLENFDVEMMSVRCGGCHLEIGSGLIITPG